MGELLKHHGGDRSCPPAAHGLMLAKSRVMHSLRYCQGTEKETHRKAQ